MKKGNKRAHKSSSEELRDKEVKKEPTVVNLKSEQEENVLLNIEVNHRTSSN